MSEYGFACPISVRAGDIDANGHVNNTVYADYFQQARATYFRQLWADDWGDASVVVATLTVDFLAPIELGNEVVVDVRVTDVGTSSWTVEYRVRAADGAAAASGASGEAASRAADGETAASGASGEAASRAGDWRVAAEGSSVQVAWDPEDATSRPLPERWREALEAELVAPDA